MTPEEKEFVCALWKNNYQFMRNRICFFGICGEDTDDVLMDCFVSLIHVRATLFRLSPKELRAYIAITVRNHCHHWHLKNRKVAVVPFEDDSLLALDRAQLPEEDLIARIDSEYQAALLLDGLNERDKLLLFGRYIEERTDEELAKTLRCKKSSVRTLLSRARKNARDILKQGKEGGSDE